VRGRSDDVRERVLSSIVEGNTPWARFAPVLALGAYVPDFAMNGKPNAAARHDLGAASACLTVEVAARGIMVHQMIGIEPDRAREAFELPESVVPLTALAIGYHADNPELDESYAKRGRGRTRKGLDEIVLTGGGLNGWRGARWRARPRRPIRPVAARIRHGKPLGAGTPPFGERSIR